MNDLISRQAAIDAIDRLDIPEGMCVFEILSHIELELGTLPSAQPEQNGKWIYNSPTTMKCDRCGFVIKDWDWHRFKFCPNCRADMRGEE